jgi:hypothetical protein
MKKNSYTQSAFFIPRLVLGLAFCAAAIVLAGLAFKPAAVPEPASERLMHDMPTLGESATDEPRDLNRLEQFWNDRLTYPTGVFNPEWVRAAAAQHQSIPTGLPAGNFNRLSSPQRLGGLQALGGVPVPMSLSTSAFTALGPSPEIMTGCTGCFDYGKTQARVNAIVIDPTTTTPGSITAYIGSVGGGVWKTTDCCTTSTTWTLLTDDPLIGTTAIDALAIDPNNPNTIYAGTGDLNFGSFSMGSQGILKSTNGGASWTILGAGIFGPAYSEPAGNYPQYAAVGKVKVDPNNSSNVAAGTKTGLYLSHDGGSTWTQCATNAFNTQRQDITGLELTNMGGGVTRIIAAVGTRGFPTFVQYDLGANGANGIYSATMGNSGCPSFTSIARNDNGFVFGAQVAGSPYLTGALMNAGTGVPCNYPISGGNGTYCGNGAVGGATTNGGTVNNLGRIDIAVAPSNPNYIYAQVASINWNNNSQCGNTNGCQLGVWVSTDGGTSWSFMTGSAGGSLPACGQGDYPQNWYDQGIAVDPNDPTRVFIDTFDTWFATSSGTAFFDITCGYNGSSVANHVVHVDHHALAFVPGSSDILLEGSDGGIFATTNASTTNATTRPTWINMDTNINTMEFYAGDISANFANDSAPSAVGGAQDNGPSSVLFAGSPTGPVSWQMGLGGDGFSGQIDSSGSTTTQASGTIAVSAIGTAGQQFAVGSQTFTWAATRTTTGEVAVGTSATSAATNLNNAINADVPPSVATSTRAGTTVTVRATTPGAGGNAIPFANVNSTNTTFNPATGTLGGGGSAGTSNRIYYEGNNSGGLSRCLASCTSPGATWSSIKGGWGSDTQSFVLPVNLFKGGIPGGDNCAAGCGHMLAASTRVFETITANVPSGGTVQWYITNNPSTQNLSKGTLGNRSYINQVKYSPKYQSVAIVGTNDGNVQIGFNLGTGVANQANWINVTGSNVVLPNRPINGIALDPSASAANLPVGYAAVGGFNANTPTTPGHVFQVTCTSNCGSFTWANKTGNLPDIPVNAIIVNPNYPQQVFAGTDFGLYLTNDVTQASPTWFRFESGLPHVMIWDMQIDGGSTTLSLWTRGRGAYVYPLPSSNISISPLALVSSGSRMTHGGAGTFDVDLTSGNGIECRSGGVNNDFTIVFKFTNIITGVDTVIPSCGSVSGTEIGADEHEFLVHLTGVTCNAQNVSVNLAGVHDSSNQTLGSANATMGLLLGDTTANRLVNSSDISQVQVESGNPVTSSNFRTDLTVNGSINSADISLAQQQSGTGLPPAPSMSPPPSTSPTPASTGGGSKKKTRKTPRNSEQSR